MDSSSLINSSKVKSCLQNGTGLFYFFLSFVLLKKQAHGDVVCNLVFLIDSLRFAETFNAKQQDMYKCIARCHVARNRFLQILRREHYVTQKFQENAQ